VVVLLVVHTAGLGTSCICWGGNAFVREVLPRVVCVVLQALVVGHRLLRVAALLLKLLVLHKVSRKRRRVSFEGFAAFSQ